MAINGVYFKLKEPHDFSWLNELGQVFCVFDQQDSGNICFGLSRGGKRQFVKYAGAITTQYTGEASQAIARLMQARGVYSHLRHDTLITMTDAFSTADGYSLVFDWFDGETLHPHWAYPPPHKYTNPSSPFYRFRKLPADLRVAILKQIFSFHVHIEAHGYVAVDFYDGSILYDFTSNKVMICDIDYYQRKPFFNRMGRLWGSSRFMSPEEFVLGSPIDGKTNVFNMGATAFCLLGGQTDRSITTWEASESLFRIARKATSLDRDMRYSSVSEFYHEWTHATN